MLCYGQPYWRLINVAPEPYVQPYGSGEPENFYAYVGQGRFLVGIFGFLLCV